MPHHSAGLAFVVLVEGVEVDELVVQRRPALLLFLHHLGHGLVEGGRSDVDHRDVGNSLVSVGEDDRDRIGLLSGHFEDRRIDREALGSVGRRG